MNRNFKRAECSAKSFFCAFMLLKLKKITFFTVKDQSKKIVIFVLQQADKMLYYIKKVIKRDFKSK